MIFIDLYYFKSAVNKINKSSFGFSMFYDYQVENTNRVLMLLEDFRVF